MVENEFGNRVTTLLRAKGMTQKQLADKVGVTEVSMSRYLGGKRVPKAPLLASMAMALDTTANDLLGTEAVPDFDSEYYRIIRWLARNAREMTPKQKSAIVDTLFENNV